MGGLLARHGGGGVERWKRRKGNHEMLQKQRSRSAVAVKSLSSCLLSKGAWWLIVSMSASPPDHVLKGQASYLVASSSLLALVSSTIAVYIVPTG